MEGTTTELGTWLFLAPFILCAVGLPVFTLFIATKGLIKFFRPPIYEYHGEWGTKEISRDEALEIALDGLPKPEANESFTYEMTLEFALLGLQRSLQFHEEGNYWGVMFLAYEFEDYLIQNKDVKRDYIVTAFTLWDSWADAIQHNWYHYPAVKAEDWPRLAEELASNIKNNQPVTNPLLLNPNSKP